MKDTTTTTDIILHTILHLSYRISAFSPPMKPFVRFSQKRESAQHQDSPFYPRLFWDFDDALQKKLLALAYEIASPDAIAQSCIEQWKSNLQNLYKNQKQALEQARNDHTQDAAYFDPRTRSIVEKIGPQSHLLYVGCGSGRECFQFAQKGLQVTGIDTMAPLLDIANGWATHLEIAVDFACMDVTRLGFKPDSFDSFVLEFYGSLPTLGQTLALQNELARILTAEGQGFIVASRKKYASYWFLMGTRYPPAMTAWLMPQASLDFFFSKADGCEERLLYGLYNKAHTLQSLSTELGHTFDVINCSYEQDPRYAIATVKRKKEKEVQNETKQCRSNLRQPPLSSRLLEIKSDLEHIELVCDQLEAHAETITTFFQHPTQSTSHYFKSLDISEFIQSLTNILALDEKGTKNAQLH